MLERHFKYIYFTAFGLLLLSAIYGLLLRWNFAYPIKGFSYNNMLQSHSHVAFLGWGFLATIGGLYQLFIKKEILAAKPVYKWAIIIMAFSIFLMLISFPLGGYDAFSVVLLSVFGLVSYVFFFHILKDLKGNSTAIKLVRFGIYYYILSSLATWFLAGVILTQGRTDLYYNTVYFYLHFLYNGYFVFMLFGFLFKIIELKGIRLSPKFQRVFFRYLNIACIPAYALSVLWSGVGASFYVIGFMGAGLQIVALIYLLKMYKEIHALITEHKVIRILLPFVIASYSLKVLLQLLSSFPYFVEKSLALKPYFIIGYLHLFTLAFMTIFLFLVLYFLNALKVNLKILRLGLVLVLLGVVLTETFLFGQGFTLLLGIGLIPSYSIWLLVCSVVLVLGMLFLLLPQFIKSNLKPQSFCQ